MRRILPGSLFSLFLLSVIAAPILLTGCESDPYSSVSGTVTYKGEPVSDGEIRFMPDSRGGNKGPAFVAMVKNGEYATPEGKGLVGGKYMLRIMGNGKRIRSNDPTAPEFGDPMFKPVTQTADFPVGEDVVHNIVIDE